MEVQLEAHVTSPNVTGGQQHQSRKYENLT